MTNNAIAKQLLEEYGSAIRGDWGSIDGRVVRNGLEEIADIIDDRQPVDISVMRTELDLCPVGDGHWSQHCGADCSEGGL